MIRIGGAYMLDNGILKPEDYIEPACVLCGTPYGVTPEVKSIPQQRIIEKMDEYMSRRDYRGAERHLLYWLEEARLGHDRRGELLVRGELVGHYRKVGDREKALMHGEEALKLIEELDFGETISAGTAYTNVATAMNAFGENERAMELFKKARAIYESSTSVRPELLGGLYNNMALTGVSLKDYAQAHELYALALDAMGRVPSGCLEQAITLLNMANLTEAEEGLEAGEAKIDALAEKAYALLISGDAPHDGYYAFVCEKCAPTFSYYGWFLAAQELKKRAEGIYAGT